MRSSRILRRVEWYFRTDFSRPISVLSSRVKNYQSTLRKIPEECRFHLYRGGSLKSRILNVFEKGVLRKTSRRRIRCCKTQHYSLLSSSKVVDYQSNEDGPRGGGKYCTHSKKNADRISVRKTERNRLV
jgi:hypothetical protein